MMNSFCLFFLMMATFLVFFLLCSYYNFFSDLHSDCTCQKPDIFLLHNIFATVLTSSDILFYCFSICTLHSNSITGSPLNVSNDLQLFPFFCLCIISLHNFLNISSSRSAVTMEIAAQWALKHVVLKCS